MKLLEMNDEHQEWVINLNQWAKEFLNAYPNFNIENSSISYN